MVKSAMHRILNKNPLCWEDFLALKNAGKLQHSRTCSLEVYKLNHARQPQQMIHDSHNCMGHGVWGKTISQGGDRDQGHLSSLLYIITVGG